MRWKNQDARKTDLATGRTISRFLFFPKKIGDETRWLEFAKWEEECMAVDKWCGGIHPFYPGYAWIPMRWLPTTFTDIDKARRAARQ